MKGEDQAKHMKVVQCSFPTPGPALCSQSLDKIVTSHMVYFVKSRFETPCFQCCVCTTFAVK